MGPKKIKKSILWKTANGEEIKIEDMNTSHIKNCINKIKKSNWRVEYLEALENELKRRNLSVASNNDDDKDTISEQEKIYFLETSCEYTTIKLDESEVEELTVRSGLDNFIDLYFIIDKDKTGKELKKDIFDSLVNLPLSQFYNRYNDILFKKPADEEYNFYKYNLTDEKLKNFLENYFILDKVDPLNFKKKMKRDIFSIPRLEFYSKYNEYLLDNVFTKEWKSFIDLMLGRRNNEKI